MFSLTPKNDKFYDLFINFSKDVYKESVMLRDFVYDLSDAETKMKQIKNMEIKCDQNLHQIMEELNKTFITPIDREDIYTIGKQTDEIADFIEATAIRFIMFNVSKSTPEAKALADLIMEAAKQFIQLMEELKVVHKNNNLLPVIVEINRLEEECDEAYRKAVRRLFTDEFPVLDVLKWREIYEHLENTLDAMEDVANTVEGIVMKHA